METTQYIFHTDAEHGWLAVPMAELMQLGIGKYISSSSRRRGDVAYLEVVTGDAFAFFRAKGWTNLDQDQSPFHTVDDGELSPIRSYSQFILDLPAEEGERVAFEHAEREKYRYEILERLLAPFPQAGCLIAALDDQRMVSTYPFWAEGPDRMKRKAMANFKQSILRGAPENRDGYQWGICEHEGATFMLARPREEPIDESINRFCKLLPPEMVRAAFEEAEWSDL